MVSSIKQLKNRVLIAVNERVCSLGHGEIITTNRRMQVHVHELTKDKDALVISDSLAKWERAYHIESIVVRGETIVVADKLRSVAVLRLSTLR